MIFMAMDASSGGVQYLFELSKQLNNKEGGKKKYEYVHRAKCLKKMH
jgi:hypothetical protein